MFQVGTQNSYFPAAITLNPGSAVGTIGVNASAGVFSNGTGGVQISNYEPMVYGTWFFQNNIGTGLNADMQVWWQAAAEVNGFKHTGDYISHYTAGAWDEVMADTMTASLNAGLYTVTRTNVTSMSPFAVFDQSTVPTGVASVNSANGAFQIYPNPTDNNLYVTNPALNTGNTIYVEVYNTLGQVVTKTQYNNQLLVLPVSSLPSGDYLIRLYNDDMSVVKKFIKE
jgi:Secretion system C-terminal sorting domain